MKKTNVIYYNSTLLKGGTDTYMLELIKNIDKSKFQVDVLIKDGDVVDSHMLALLNELGSNVHLAKGSFFKRMMFLKNFFKTNKKHYDVCHINATSQGTGIIAYFAKKIGKVPKVVFHSHMGGNDNKKGMVDKIGTKLMFKFSDNLASCSNLASKFMFGDEFENSSKVQILNNSVDTKKFAFNKQIRTDIRKELGIESDSFVILHVGRFAPQKNHKSLILIFNEILKTEPSAKLLLIGDGVLFEEVKTFTKELNIENNVLFLGLQNDVFNFMNAADCFVMPSIHEGLPIVAVEAQANGLPLVLSENISKETQLAENVEFVSLESPLNVWAGKILSTKKLKRVSGEDVLKQHNFDHKSAIKIVEELYTKQG